MKQEERVCILWDSNPDPPRRLTFRASKILHVGTVNEHYLNTRYKVNENLNLE